MGEKNYQRAIRDWFYQYRPDIAITETFVKDIYDDIKDELADLNNTAGLLILREYLRLNYASVIKDIVERLVQEDPYDELFSQYREVGLIYNDEIGAIMEKVQEKGIVEKLGYLTDEEMNDSEELANEIRKVLDDYMAYQDSDEK